MLLTDEHLCSFAHTVRVDNATMKWERIMEKCTFPLKSMPLFLQENGYSSLKNVLKMYQRWRIMKICTRSVCVQFLKAHVWKHYLLLTNRRVGREAVCVMLQINCFNWRTRCTQTNALYYETVDSCKTTFILDTNWTINLHLVIQHAWHTLGGPCTCSLPPFLDLPDLVFWHVVECNVLY